MGEGGGHDRFSLIGIWLTYLLKCGGDPCSPGSDGPATRLSTLRPVPLFARENALALSLVFFGGAKFSPNLATMQFACQDSIFASNFFTTG